MTTPPSIRARLASTLAAFAVVSGLAVAAAVWGAVQHEADELLDGSLSASAAVLAGLLAQGSTQEGDVAPPPRVGPQTQAPPEDVEFAWQLVDADGAVRRRSAHAPGAAFASPPRFGFSDSGQWRLLGLPFANPGQVLYVAQNRAERQEAIVEIAVRSAAAALAVSVLGMLWMRRQVARELEPLEALSRAVTRFDPLRPDAPLGAALRAEFVPVHRAIDLLGRGLAQRVANERVVTAHAAHALRTPLAGIDAQLAVALREAPPELRPRLGRVRAAAEHLQRVVVALLALFRAGSELHLQEVDVAGLLGNMPIDGLAVDVVTAATLTADPDLLAAALLNLLDNALRHGARQVTLSVNGSVLRLRDDGPGVPTQRRIALQEALDQQAYERPLGSGLAVADRVARAHGGALRLVESDCGFEIELALAAVPAAEDEGA